MYRNFDTMTAADWRAYGDELIEAAKIRDKRAADSFARSDTDGFVSQWASTITADEMRTKAAIARDGGVAVFDGLYQGNRRVAAKLVWIRNRYHGGRDAKWMLRDDEAATFGRKWIPAGKRSRVQRDLGLCERAETAPAWAKIHGTGTGLAGAASCHVVTYRRGDEFGKDAKLVAAAA